MTLQSARKLSEAGNSLLHAKHFKELLSVCPANISKRFADRAMSS